MFNIYLAVSNFLSRLVATGDKCNSPLLRTTMEYLSTAFGNRSKLPEIQTVQMTDLLS